MPGSVAGTSSDAHATSPVAKASHMVPSVTRGAVVMVAVLGVAGLFAASPSREVDAKPVDAVSSAPRSPPVTSTYGEKVLTVPEADEARCVTPPPNGDILLTRVELLREGGHALEINNGSGREAIVKVRYPRQDQTQLSFFVADGSNVTLEGIPDGSYRILFAFGDTLDAACRNFIGEHEAQEFPGITNLATETTSMEIITSFLSFTLHAVPSGNIHPKDIPEEIFDRD
jgi:hypothetical protein